MFRREPVVESHHRRAGLDRKLARRPLVGRGRAEGPAAAVDEEDRLAPEIARGQEDMRPPPVRRLDAKLARHGGLRPVPAPVAGLGRRPALGRRQERRIGLHPVLGQEPVEHGAHFGSKGQAHGCTFRAGVAMPCPASGASVGMTSGPKSTMVAM